MKTTRIFAVLFLLLFSCQTTMKTPAVTQRALELTAFSSEKSKLSLKSYFFSRNNKAFALNPTNKNYWWSWGNQYIDTAKVQALSNCGSGCELFAVNDKIVWPYPAKEISNNTKSSVTTTSQSSTQEEQIIFNEDFNNNSNRWFLLVNDNSVKSFIKNGKYLFENKNKKDFFWATKEVIIDTQQNFQIDLNIKKNSGENSYGYGILWGVKTRDKILRKFYSFIVNGNGRYHYGKQDGKLHNIIGWTPSQYIKKDNSDNKLSVKKLGNNIEFWINDNYVNKMKFEEFFGNEIGFIIDHEKEIEIDNLIVQSLNTDDSSLDVAQHQTSQNNTISQSITEPKILTQQQPTTQKSESQTPSQPKPAEPKTQPTVQLTQAIQQIQQPQPIQQQQQTTVYAKPQIADKRIALVIGNEKYINAPLENPVNDSRAIGNSLKKLGFKTLEYENLSQKAMKRAIDDFGTHLKNYDVGLFFYSGHGTQIKGENYLIPIDAAPKSENEVDYDCIPAGRVLAQMENTGSVTNIIILDACRNNPFERSWSRSSQSKGLVFMNAPSGSLIAYSTSPGKIAFDQSSQKNSPYTAALLKHIETPDISIVQMFQRVRVTVEHETGKEQTPWESTSLRDDFYFYRADGQ